MATYLDENGQRIDEFGEVVTDDDMSDESWALRETMEDRNGGIHPTTDRA